MLLIGITLLVDPYLVARIIILSVLVVTSIKFIDNNTVVHIISSKINNKSVTLLVIIRIGITSLLSSNMVFLGLILGTLINCTFRSSYR